MMVWNESIGKAKDLEVHMRFLHDTAHISNNLFQVIESSFRDRKSGVYSKEFSKDYIRCNEIWLHFIGN